MKYILNLIVNVVLCFVLVNALIYIGCIAMQKPFNFGYLYNVVVPVILGIAATEARNKTKKSK